MSLESPRHVAPRRALAIVTVVVAVATLVLACHAWSLSATPLGERRYAPERVWSARAAAGALFASAHAAIVGVALPLIYRRRATYAAIALIGGLAAALSGVTAAALYAAAAR